MYARNENGVIKPYGSLPNFVNGIHNFQLADKETHEANGFFSIVIPKIAENQRKGSLYFNDDHFAYKIIDLTQAEIETNTKQKAKETQEQLLQQGVLVDFQDTQMWFNEFHLKSFINAIILADRLDENIVWKDANKDLITLTVDEAYIVANDGKNLIQAIYFNI